LYALDRTAEADGVWMWNPAQAMADLELKRTPGDRRLYALEGVGTLRLEGFASRTATAEAGGGSWRIARRRFWQRVIQATDAAGTPVGEFEPRDSGVHSATPSSSSVPAPIPHSQE